MFPPKKKTEAEKKLAKVDKRRKKYARKVTEKHDPEHLKVGKKGSYELKGSTKEQPTQESPKGKRKVKSKSKHYMVAALPKKYKDVDKITETKGTTERKETNTTEPEITTVKTKEGEVISEGVSKPGKVGEAKKVASKKSDVQGEGVQSQEWGRKLRKLTTEEKRQAKVENRPDKLQTVRKKYKTDAKGKSVGKRVVKTKSFGEKGMSKYLASEERKDLKKAKGYGQWKRTSEGTYTRDKVKGRGRSVKVVTETKSELPRKGDGFYKQQKPKKYKRRKNR